MSTTEYFFHGETRKNINIFGLKTSAFSGSVNICMYMYYTCKWKYKYLSLSSSSGWRLLTREIASSIQPFCILSRILIRSSSSFRSMDGWIPVSKRNFSADSLKPSGMENRV